MDSEDEELTAPTRIAPAPKAPVTESASLDDTDSAAPLSVVSGSHILNGPRPLVNWSKNDWHGYVLGQDSIAADIVDLLQAAPPGSVTWSAASVPTPDRLSADIIRIEVAGKDSTGFMRTLANQIDASKTLKTVRGAVAGQGESRSRVIEGKESVSLVIRAVDLTENSDGMREFRLLHQMLIDHVPQQEKKWQSAVTVHPVERTR